MRQDHGGRPSGSSGAPPARTHGWDDGRPGDRTWGDRAVPPPREGRDGGGPASASTPGGGPGDGPPRTDRRRRRTRSRRTRILIWVAVVLAVAVLGTAGGGWLYLRHLNGNLGTDSLNLGGSKLDRSAPNAAGQRPLNILLLGSDSRNSAANLKLGGSREDQGRKPLADVQMLLHVSADRSSMSVVSVPRDTMVDIPECSKDGQTYPATKDRINTSLQHGGPGCSVATWEDLTGIPVDHFMMIDFAGVVSMADAVGGVPVCVSDNVYDPDSHLRLKKGESVVKGEQALQWLRTRHGFGDGTDIGRARAQHMYMGAMVRQLKSGTKLTDPGKLTSLAEAATEALTVDDSLDSVTKLYDLGSDLRRVPTNRITMATMPWEYAAGGAYVVPKPGEAEQVFSLIRQDRALDGKDAGSKSKKAAEPKASPKAHPAGEVPVTVQNGTGTGAQLPVTGRAAQVAETLTGAGWTQATTDATPKSQADTTISYPDEAAHGDALALAKKLGVPESLVRHSTGVESVTVSVGADWREGASYPKTAASADDTPDKAPDSADALTGDDDSQCMDVNPNNVW